MSKLPLQKIHLKKTKRNFKLKIYFLLLYFIVLFYFFKRNKTKKK